jgi:hypothetical protein
LGIRVSEFGFSSVFLPLRLILFDPQLRSIHPLLMAIGFTEILPRACLLPFA